MIFFYDVLSLLCMFIILVITKGGLYVGLGVRVSVCVGHVSHYLKVVRNMVVNRVWRHTGEIVSDNMGDHLGSLPGPQADSWYMSQQKNE